MKRLLDSLLSRWYVPRTDVFLRFSDVSLEDIQFEYNRQMARKLDRLGRQLASSQIVVTTDYRQAPCS